MTSNKTAALDQYGWVILKEEPSTPLIKVAARYGSPIPTRYLGPINRKLTINPDANKDANSLSAINGLQELPMHTDCAYYRSTPRYIFFRATKPTLVGTLLLDGNELRNAVQGDLQNAMYLVSGISKKFLCNAFRPNCIRWDPNCMKPVDLIAKTIDIEIHSFLRNCSTKVHRYTDLRSILMIDNHRILHGRENASEDMDRELESVTTI